MVAPRVLPPPSSRKSRRRPEPPVCRHCGADLIDERMRRTGFCCAGCAYVHRLVHEQGLENYYRLKDDVTPPADPAVFEDRDYDWLQAAQQAAENTARRRQPPAVPSLDLEVQGISCVGCVWLIERVFQQQPGARDVLVNAQLGTMRLRWIPGEFGAADFARRLQGFGYLVGPAGVAPAEGEGRSLVRRIGLCGAFALNVMLFTLPGYFGMDPSFEYARLFGLLSFLFGTLSFLVGGSYFLGRAVRALREGSMHIDLPIALGILGAYVGSVYGWFSGNSPFVYFDFVATFILLMLVGRWAQVATVERNRRRLLRLQPRPPRVRLEEGGEIPCEELACGRKYWAATGQTVPVASRLLAGQHASAETPPLRNRQGTGPTQSVAATLSLASINGEAEPRVFHPGQPIPAGAVNVGCSAVLLEAGEAWADSLLARLLQPGERAGSRHRLLERVVRGYLFGILAAAAAAGAGWALSGAGVAQVWSVVTAVLVVSCPCAIGLAFPLADEFATLALRRRGVFVREEDLWPRLGQVHRIVFDKTGTLTLETPVLRNPEALEALPDEARSALLGLVTDNSHPVSLCLLENLLAFGVTEPSPEGALRETVGYGVTRGEWSLGRPGWHGGGGRTTALQDLVADEDGPGDVELCRDGRVVARFRFGDTARANARSEVERLGRAGFDLRILSGDRPEKVKRLAGELGLEPARALGGLGPGEKAAWLEANDADHTLMLGDGANDSLAFDRALCRGTPVVHRGALERKADFYYLGRGIDGIRALFEVNAVRSRTQVVNLIFSAVYNLAAVSFAAAGAINPLVAAILMPTNSLLTLLLVTGGMRRALRRDPIVPPPVTSGTSASVLPGPPQPDSVPS